MQEYPKTVFNHNVTSTDDKYNVGFHIRHLSSSKSFSTSYYDVTLEKGKRLYISKDDIKATKLSGFNYHKNAQIRSIILDMDVDIDQKVLAKIINNNLDNWVTFLSNIDNGEEIKLSEFIESLKE